MVHKKGLGCGLENDLRQANEMAKIMDFCLYELPYVSDNEASFYMNSGAEMAVWHDYEKAVMVIEYRDNYTETFCSLCKSYGFNGIIKRPELDAWVKNCETDSGGGEGIVVDGDASDWSEISTITAGANVADADWNLQSQLPESGPMVSFTE